MKKNSEKLPVIIKKLSSPNPARKAFLILIVFALFGACKDYNEIGLNVLPPSDEIGTDYCDTITVITSTQKEDSLRGDELTFQLFGSDLDPVYGLTTASIYTQVSLSGTPAWGDSIKADSLILSLAYANTYGDTMKDQTISVFRMREKIIIDSLYYTWRYFAHDSMETLGVMTFKPEPKKIATVNGQLANPQLRVKLSQTLADSLITWYSNGSGILGSNSAWVNHFNGLFIKAHDNTQPAAISYFSFPFSYLTLYFHDTTDVTLKYNYNFSLNNARVNNFKHDFTGSPIDASFNVETDSVNYLLSMTGARMKISFPFLKHFTDSGSILVNRAELQITSKVGFGYPTPPLKLILATRDAAGAIVPPIDYYEPSGYFNGSINSSGDGYSFNITRHIQQYLEGNLSNADFILAITGSGVEATRVAIRSGANTSDLKMKLKLTYTKLN